MKKFFIKQCGAISTSDITSLQIDEYRKLLITEMLKLGASENEIELIRTPTIINSIRNNRKPEDVAWAILQ